jgi:chromosome segregation ATPase
MTTRRADSELMGLLEGTLDTYEDYIGPKAWEALDSVYEDLDEQAKALEDELEEKNERIKELEEQIREMEADKE